MSEKNAKLLRKYDKYVNVVPRATTRKQMIDQLIAAGHLDKIVARRKRSAR